MPDSMASYGFPGFWIEDTAGLYSQNLNSGLGEAAHFAEFDIYEGPHITRPYGDTNAFDWTTRNGGGFGTNNVIVQQYSGFMTNRNALHSYGMLWVPSTLNSGTGLITFYLDRLQVGNAITYTSAAGASPPCWPSNVTGCLFIGESGAFTLMMEGGGTGSATYPINMQSVNVWQFLLKRDFDPALNDNSPAWLNDKAA